MVATTYEQVERAVEKKRREERREAKFVLVRAKPKDKEARSPALSFVGMIWDLAQQETGHSWTRFNGSLRQALMNAIEAGLIFHDDDFKFMADHWRAGYWFGQDNAGLGEGIYARAVKYRNFQACRSFEKWIGREPFIFDGERLSVGSDVDIPGGRWEVTSFAKDGQSAVICQHEWKDEKRKIKSRSKLTLERVRGLSRSIEQSRKTPEKVYCAECGAEREKAGECPCGSVHGVKNGKFGKLATA